MVQDAYLYILKVKSDKRKDDAKTRIALFGLQHGSSSAGETVLAGQGIGRQGNRASLPPHHGIAACEKIVSATLTLEDEGGGGKEREAGGGVAKSID